ncbi:MAG TPA: mannosyltransferase family protein [Ardenticatenaceae bacterium]|nr:mannosyltransferase family protein [Ardenticatenaceae bacterium]
MATSETKSTLSVPAREQDGARTLLLRRLESLSRAYSWPVGLFLVSRLGVFLVVYFGLIHLPPAEPFHWHPFPGNLLLDGWSRWDAGWYKLIAESGYSYKPESTIPQTSVAFLPLYPLAIRAFNLITHNSAGSGLLVSNVSFGVALLLLYKLVSDDYGTTVGRRTTALLATYPFSFYFSAIYTESLFFLTIVAAFFFGVRGRWGWAALFAGLASATRVSGITIGLGLLFLYLERVSYDVRRIRADVLFLLLSPLGLVAYMFFLWYNFGDPLLFITATNVPGWHLGVGLDSALRVLGGAWHAILSIRPFLAGAYESMSLVQLVAGALAIVVLVATARKIRVAYVVWAAAYILVSSSHWIGMARYILPAFPVFLGIALLVKQESRYWAILYFNSLFLALLAIMYTHLVWIS